MLQIRLCSGIRGVPLFFSNAMSSSACAKDSADTCSACVTSLSCAFMFDCPCSARRWNVPSRSQPLSFTHHSMHSQPDPRPFQAQRLLVFVRKACLHTRETACTHSRQRRNTTSHCAHKKSRVKLSLMNLLCHTIALTALLASTTFPSTT